MSWSGHIANWSSEDHFEKPILPAVQLQAFCNHMMMGQYQELRERRKARARSSAHAQLRANLRTKDISRDALEEIFASRMPPDVAGSDSMHRRAFKQLLVQHNNFGLSREQAGIIVDGLADKVGLIFWNEFVETACPPRKVRMCKLPCPAAHPSLVPGTRAAVLRSIAAQVSTPYSLPASVHLDQEDEVVAWRTKIEDPAGLLKPVSPPERKQFRHDVNETLFELSRVKAEAAGRGLDHRVGQRPTPPQWYRGAMTPRFTVFEAREGGQGGGLRLGYATLRPPADGARTDRGVVEVTVGGKHAGLGPQLRQASQTKRAGRVAEDSTLAQIREDAPAVSFKPVPPKAKPPRRQRTKPTHMTARQQGAQAVMEHAGVCKTMNVVMAALMKAGGDGKFSDETRQPLYLFKKLDRDRSGALDHKELVDGLKRVASDGGESVNDRHVELFVRAIDANNDGQIVFAEFMDGLLRFKADSARQMLRAASYSLGGQDWKQLFCSYDKDHNGSLDFTEFRGLIRSAAKIGVSVIGEEMLAQLFRLIDGDGTGTIDWEEFEQHLQNDMLALADGTAASLGGGESVLDNALRRIAAAIEATGASQSAFFDRLDVDGDGELTVAELELAVCELTDNGQGTRLTREEAAAIVALCDVNGDATVDRAEFLAALKARSSAARNAQDHAGYAAVVATSDDGGGWLKGGPAFGGGGAVAQASAMGGVAKRHPSAGPTGFYASVEFQVA